MDIRQLTPDLGVTGQISPADVKAIADAGYRSLICNRPDHEGGVDQPTFKQIEAAASSLGLAVRYMPVVSGQITEDNVRDFQSATASMPRPVLAYCRTGTRSGNLHALAQQLGPR